MTHKGLPVTHKTQTTEKRQGALRRQINGLVMRDGEMQEAKFWANLFKAAALWLLLLHSEAVLRDWGLLTVLLLVGIAPDLLKKLITMRFSGNETAGVQGKRT